jgi:hypothetical protein
MLQKIKKNKNRSHPESAIVDLDLFLCYCQCETFAESAWTFNIDEKISRILPLMTQPFDFRVKRAVVPR